MCSRPIVDPFLVTNWPIVNAFSEGQNEPKQSKRTESPVQHPARSGTNFGKRHVRSFLPLEDLYRGGGDFGRGEFRGENFAVKKSGEIFPLAKVSTVNSDMRSGVPSREKGPGMFLFATCSGCACNFQLCLLVQCLSNPVV